MTHKQDMPIKALALDYDGVIVESVGVKDWAFEELFKDRPQHLDAIMRYHKDHNALIRFEKFHHIVEEILKEPYTQEKAQELKEKFSRLALSKLISCPFVRGAKEFLEYYQNKTPLYLVSINPEDELDQILRARGLKNYFKSIYPFPWKKKDALLNIASKEGILGSEVLFIGDSPEDRQAASEAGVRFIGRRSDRYLSQMASLVFSDLTEIRVYLERTTSIGAKSAVTAVN